MTGLKLLSRTKKEWKQRRNQHYTALGLTDQRQRRSGEIKKSKWVVSVQATVILEKSKKHRWTGIIAEDQR